MNFILLILQCICKLNVTTTKVFHLGKKRENTKQPQHRPLLQLVSLGKESDKDALAILACSGQLCTTNIRTFTLCL